MSTRFRESLYRRTLHKNGSQHQTPKVDYISEWNKAHTVYIYNIYIYIFIHIYIYIYIFIERFVIFQALPQFSGKPLCSFILLGSMPFSLAKSYNYSILFLQLSPVEKTLNWFYIYIYIFVNIPLLMQSFKHQIPIPVFFFGCCCSRRFHAEVAMAPRSTAATSSNDPDGHHSKWTRLGGSMVVGWNSTMCPSSAN